VGSGSAKEEDGVHLHEQGFLLGPLDWLRDAEVIRGVCWVFRYVHGGVVLGLEAVAFNEVADGRETEGAGSPIEDEGRGVGVP
jgi:hypothetical protein